MTQKQKIVFFWVNEFTENLINTKKPKTGYQNERKQKTTWPFVVLLDVCGTEAHSSHSARTTMPAINFQKFRKPKKYENSFESYKAIPN